MLAHFSHTMWCQTTKYGNHHSDTASRTSNFMKWWQTPQHRYQVYLGIAARTQLFLVSAATLLFTLLFNLSHLYIVSDMDLGNIVRCSPTDCLRHGSRNTVRCLPTDCLRHGSRNTVRCSPTDCLRHGSRNTVRCSARSSLPALFLYGW
jgi:hypothetical protein